MSKQIIDWEELNLEDIFSEIHDDEDQENFQVNLLARYSDKTFKYYVLNTNFNLSALILRKIANVPGVERLIPITRYRALVNFAKLFSIEEVQKNINKEITKLFYPKALRKKNGDKPLDGVN